jgi:Fe-S cluster assembly ATP-binding protein
MSSVTTAPALIDHVAPERVHVLARGRIIRSGGPELALELEKRGYDWLLGAAA